MTTLKETRGRIAAKLESESKRLAEIATRIREASDASNDTFWEGVADEARHLPAVVESLSDLHEEITAQANKLRGVGFILPGDRQS